MGIAFGIFTLVATALWCALIWFANSMSDAPDTALRVWPWFLGGCALSALFFATHFIEW